MFVGEYQHTLDEKGRVILPARFRERLSTGLVVTRGMDRCLTVWTNSAFEKLVEQTRSLPRDHKRARWHKRLVTSGAHDDTPDSQGRIVVPPHLREYAGLSRDLTICGNDDNVEIWDRQRWAAELQVAENDYADLDEPLDWPGRT